MVRAWYMDDSSEDQRLEHHLVPPQFLSLDDLYQKTGICHCKIDADHFESDSTLQTLKKDHNIDHHDVLEMSREKVENFDETVKTLYREHLHSEEESRLVLDGSTYFDVRDTEDRWIRIHITKGDLLTLPAGIYHRGTVDTKNYVKILRLFVANAAWNPINRPADGHPARQEYLNRMSAKGQLA